MNKALHITRLQDHPEYTQAAAEWFHAKWRVPLAAYVESIEECQRGRSLIPQWYVVLDQERIIAGLGVIANDFHSRPDLTPNICAVYVEEGYRGQGIAGAMLDFVCREFAADGIPTLYLVTGHASFYERYSWEYLCQVQCQGEAKPSRMYRHRQKRCNSR